MLKEEKLMYWMNFHTLIFDFDGVFTDNCLYLNEKGQESVKCDRADGLGLDILRNFIKKHSWDLDFFILSTEKNNVVLERAKKLKIKAHNGVSNKLEFIKNYLKDKYGQYSDSKSGVIYVGNDLNDLSSMIFCGYSISPSDAHDSIKKISDLIVPKKGGNGLVREIIEMIINIDNMSLEEKQNII